MQHLSGKFSTLVIYTKERKLKIWDSTYGIEASVSVGERHFFF